MNRKAEVLLKLTNGLGVGSVVVEAGALRFYKETPTDGYSSFYLAKRAKERGWLLYIVDNNQSSVATTRQVLRDAGLLQNVVVVQAEADKWLGVFADKIDCLYLDMSRDADARALQAAYDKLGDLVIIDDTNVSKDGEYGEGSLAIPWILAQGGWLLESYPTEMQSDGIHPMLMSSLKRSIIEKPSLLKTDEEVTEEDEDEE